ncbi:MAG: ATP-grasp domain-containing protein [Candidatus Omnitrophica bacterium]|nr:ATP-grasp domain-containing protein [Candidatus Omnitrophota bacterium]
MNVAVLYRKPFDLEQGYSQDSQGRGDLKHIMRVKDALQALDHTPHLINLNLDSYEYLRKMDFDLVFNLCDDGFRNNALLEAHIPAMLDILQISYTGSNFLSLATCVNKARTKEILVFHGIPTPEFQVFYRNNGKLKEGLHFPLIVKPLHEDASIGLRRESVVSNPAGLKERVDFVLNNYNQPALVERFIAGREVYVGILGHKENLTVLPVSEIVFGSNLAQTAKICSYEAKWVPESQQYQRSPVECPAKLDKTLRQRLIEIAKRAYSLLDCRDYGRIDFRIDGNRRPYVLEVNPNPDISEDAGLAKMAKASGMSYDELIEKILGFALTRLRLTSAKTEVAGFGG